jgi:hypothetical protein
MDFLRGRGGGRERGSIGYVNSEAPTVEHFSAVNRPAALWGSGDSLTQVIHLGQPGKIEARRVRNPALLSHEIGLTLMTLYAVHPPVQAPHVGFCPAGR